MERLAQDLTFAFRMLVKSPAFTALAVLTLALGIGANAVIFSAVDAVLLRPLPYPHAERLYDVLSRWPRGGLQSGVFIGDYNWLAAHCQSCAAVAAVVQGSGGNLAGVGAPLRVRTSQVTASYFRLIGLPPELGRGFTTQDELVGAPGVALLSDSLWRQRFGAAPNVVGRSLRLDDALYTIVGVARPHSDPTASTDLWTALHPEDPSLADQGPNIGVSVRLKPGVALARAQAEMTLLAAAYNRRHPSKYEIGLALRGMQTDLLGDFEPQLLLLLYAVALVLLIACVNVANLLLSRANARRREMAIRAALGAGRARLIRQLLTESVLLGLIGGALGLIFAWVGLPLLLHAASGGGNADFLMGPGFGQFFAASPVRVNLHVLLYAFALAVGTGVLFGLAPAWQLASHDLHGSLKEEGSRGGGGGARRRRTQSTLVVGEVALAYVLLAGAALLVASFAYLQRLDVGFDTHTILTIDTSLTGTRQTSVAAAARYLDRSIASLERLPGVASAAAIVGMPLVRGMNGGFRASGPHPQGYAQLLPVTARFFPTLGLTIAQGRDFTPADASGEPVCIVSADLARRHWPAGRALGQQIVMGKAYRVVGVTAPARMMAYDMGQMANVYVPLAQFPSDGFALATHWFPIAFLIRAHGNPARLEQPALRVLAAVDPEQPFFGVRTLDQVRGDTFSQYRFLVLLLGIFAALALILGAIGIYGVMSQTVAQRTHEIGIRIALGASRGGIVALVLHEALVLAAVGLGIGVVASFFAGRLLAGQLYGVQATNPGLLVAVAVALLVVAWAASQLPALRATRVDPTASLRAE